MVIKTTEMMSAAAVLRPIRSNTGARSPDSLSAPKAAARKPDSVTPTWATERKRFGSAVSLATNCPRLPR